jgi:hypothetical protein
LLGKDNRVKFRIPSISCFYKAFKDDLVFV